MSDIKRVREREGGEQFSEEIFLAVGRTRVAGWQEEGLTRTRRGLTASEKAIWHGCQGITSLRKPPFEFLQDYTAQYFGIIPRFEAAAI